MHLIYTPFEVTIECKHCKEGFTIASAKYIADGSEIIDFTDEHSECPIEEKFGKTASEIRMWLAFENFQIEDFRDSEMGGGLL